MFLVTVHLLVNADDVDKAGEVVHRALSTLGCEVPEIADWGYATIPNPTATYPKYIRVPFRHMHIPDEYAYENGFVDLMYNYPPQP